MMIYQRIVAEYWSYSHNLPNLSGKKEEEHAANYEQQKVQDGVLRIPGDAGKDVNDFFSYEDLVDQKINVLDLFMHPGI